MGDAAKGSGHDHDDTIEALLLDEVTDTLSAMGCIRSPDPELRSVVDGREAVVWHRAVNNFRGAPIPESSRGSGETITLYELQEVLQDLGIQTDEFVRELVARRKKSLRRDHKQQGERAADA